MTVQALWVGVLVGVVMLVAAAAPVTVDRVEGSLRYQASIPKRTYAAGEVIEVSLTTRNIGGGPVSLTFYSGQRFDLLARRPRGDEVWRWSHDKAFIQVVTTVLLRPGEVLGGRPDKATWDQRDLQGRRVDPGSYEIVATFMGSVEGGAREVQLPPLAITISGSR